MLKQLTITVKEWINISDRIIKKPKIYFLDTGLCSYLPRIPTAEILEKSAFAGAFYETYVISEIIKSYFAFLNFSKALIGFVAVETL